MAESVSNFINDEKKDEFPGEHRIHFYIKAVKWFLGNVIFGLAPIILMFVVYGLSERKTGLEEIQRLIHDGVIIFVLIAIMGAVMVDYFLSGIKSSGRSIFTIYIFPLCVLAIASIDYLLTYLKIIDGTCFALGSLTTKIISILSLLYCTFTKAKLYLRENLILQIHKP